MTKYLTQTLPLIYSIFLPLVLASCSLAPFSATNTARTLGPGGVSAEIGNANSNYFIKGTAGIGESLDLGYVMEFGSVFSTSSIFGKYAIINNATGPSLAVEVGYGSVGESSHTYAGVVGSIAFTESFEVFINGRLNQVETDETDIEIGDSVGNMKVETTELTYLLASAGFNAWFSPNMGLSLYGTQGWGQDIVWENGMAFGGSLLMKF